MSLFVSHFHSRDSITAIPGDLVFADGNGMMIGPLVVAEQIIEDAAELAGTECRTGEQRCAGGAKVRIFKRNPQFKHIWPVPGIVE